MDEKVTQAEQTRASAADPAPQQTSDSTPTASAEQGVGDAPVENTTPTQPDNDISVSDDTTVEAAQPDDATDAPTETQASAEEVSTTADQGESQAVSAEDATEAVASAVADAEVEETLPVQDSSPAQQDTAQDSAEDMTMEDVLAASDEQLARKPIHRGMIVNGSVIMLSQEGIVVDVGAKIEGLLPYNQLFEFETDATKAAQYFKPNDEIQVYVIRADIPNNVIILSKKRADQERAWTLLQDIYDQNLPVEVEIVDKVRGGLVANLGVRAFLPASQVDIRRVNELDPYVGERLKVKIIELNRKRNRVIVSRRAILEEELAGVKEETLKKLEPGLQTEGEVVEITDFGAFVNLGGVDGLVHRSELSHGRFNHPREVVKLGQKVKVEVLDMDLERERINLSMKKLASDPWEDVLLNYTIGQRVEGKVTNLTPFGAFVEIEPGLEGLIHVSEMSWTKRIRHPKEILEEGEDLEAMVLKIDSDQQRISLGLRQTQPDPWSSLPDRYPPGTEITGPITGITDFGVFMEIEEGIEGLVHISELAHEHIENIEEHFSRGDEVTAVILNIDPVEQRASLSRKRLLPFTAGAGDAMATGAPASRGGRKGRRGGRRSQVIDYDYSYAASDSSSKATTKIGDVYADLFAQFGLTEASKEDEANADATGSAEAQTQTADAAASDTTEMDTVTAEADTQAETVTADSGAEDVQEEAQTDKTQVDTTDTAQASADEEDEVDPENAIDAAEAAALLTAAFREGKRPAAIDESPAEANEATLPSGAAADDVPTQETANDTNATTDVSDTSEASEEDVVAAETEDTSAVAATNEEEAEAEKTEA